jgi:3-methyl-2-oxobutanoate hydroxymethyltransferase
VKKYCNVAEVVTQALSTYCREVREGVFPGDEHCYRMIDGEEKKFVELMKRG